MPPSRPNPTASSARHPASHPEIAVAPALLDSVERDPLEVLQSLGSSPTGLTSDEAARRLANDGPNTIAQERHTSGWFRLLKAFGNPLVVLLLILSAVSWLTGDVRAGVVMLGMVGLGVTLRFIQESRAEAGAARLKGLITVTTAALRDGVARETLLAQIVSGDVITLAAGDMIPADCRILTAKDLFVVQSSLTGESMPVEKFAAPEPRGTGSPLEHANLCFLGSSVERGAATAVVVATGPHTYLGSMASILVAQPVETAFDKGVGGFTRLMIRFILVMTPLVFLINGLTKHDWHEAFFFALAVAVGLTPEMLPMIVTVCLSKGAINMSRKKVIVKHQNAIQNLGAMDLLCTDKTGTLTMDQVILERYCNVNGDRDDGVLTLAYLNSHFQTGLKNLLDRAVLKYREDLHDSMKVPEYQKSDEIPFDFGRKLMSVVVRTPEGVDRLICKGAPDELFKRCKRYELNGSLHPVEQLAAELRDAYHELSEEGFRVLALAYKDGPPKPAYSIADECDLVLRGYVAFLDPPKESAAPAIAALSQHGVDVKVLTGDNAIVSRKICRDVGLPAEQVLTGPEIEPMTDTELSERSEKTVLFARLSPGHKRRIIQALQRNGHVVGFLGDGINDAPALRAADVGISVDTAVDIAKDSADLILLEKSLMVLDDGVMEGRKVFVNILKYIRMGASSNFGNMFSVLGASLFLPFVPMTSIQILANNMLYDISQIPIPSDEVDPAEIARPRPWSMKEITRFILFVGPCSSVFDYTTFWLMLRIYGCWDPARAALFHTGWFVESLLTQTLIIHVIRTQRIPFIQSRPGWALTATTLGVMAFGAWLPYSPFAPMLGFEPLPLSYWPFVGVTLLAYMTLTHFIKTTLLKKNWL